jgi:beta-fructofuranosidase
MPLTLPDHWLWDFWFAQPGDDEVHVFYLQAPRALGDPDARHRNATIGHAVSSDLRTWRVLPDALHPGPPGAFDDLATWTGSVLRHDGRWHMLYTGVSRDEAAAVQRVGLASSEDLVTWERHGMVCEADPARYGTADWRDPWVVWDEDTGRFHMLVTATAADGPADARGVIGHAWSQDLRSWEVGAPVMAPGELRQLEVPQLVHLGGAWRILFSATLGDHGAERLRRAGVVAQCGTHCLRSSEKFGGYALDGDDFLVGNPFYAGRVLHHRGAWAFLAWRLHDEHGRFAGNLSDPMAIEVGADGSLSVDVPRERAPREHRS